MALTTTIVRSDNGPLGRVCVANVTFDNSYPTGGETFDLTAAPFTGTDAFTAVDSIAFVEGPYTSAGAPIARTLCSGLRYAPAAARAVATGKLFADKEDGTSGVTTEVGNTTDLSTVVCRVQIKGR